MSTSASSTGFAAPGPRVASFASDLLGREGRRPLAAGARGTTVRAFHSTGSAARRAPPPAPPSRRLAGQVVGRGRALPAAPSRGRSSPAARRTAPAGSPGPPAPPAARSRRGPACRCGPTARVCRARRTRATTSWLVGPAGLSTSRAPISSCVLLAELAEDLVDPRRVLQAAVQLEAQLRHDPGGQRLGRPARAGSPRRSAGPRAPRRARRRSPITLTRTVATDRSLVTCTPSRSRIRSAGSRSSVSSASAITCRTVSATWSGRRF